MPNRSCHLPERAPARPPAAATSVPRRLPETDPTEVADRHRSTALCVRRAPGIGSSNRDCPRPGKAWLFASNLSCVGFHLRPHARSTHVSLLPPPCEELPPKDPRRSATLVNPPGTS